MEERFSSYPIRVVIAASRPESMKQGDLLVEGMISYQPMCQGYESPFGKFGIPSRYQSKSMEANLKVSGDLKDGVQVKEHWIFDSQATGEVVSKAELAEELIQSITREILKLLLNEPSRLNP